MRTIFCLVLRTYDDSTGAKTAAKEQRDHSLDCDITTLACWGNNSERDVLRSGTNIEVSCYTRVK